MRSTTISSQLTPPVSDGDPAPLLPGNIPNAILDRQPVDGELAAVVPSPPRSVTPPVYRERRTPLPRMALVLRDALRPPVRKGSFWTIQAMVVALAVLHLLIDITTSGRDESFPTGIPVEVLLIPVGFAALWYGLSGAVATSIWATLLWLPDLALPADEGHRGNDIIELSIVVAIGVFMGMRVERERRERLRADDAEREHAEAEVRYRELFNVNASPTIIVNGEGRVQDANPAAQIALGPWIIGADAAGLLGIPPSRLVAGTSSTARLARPSGDGRDYRLLVSEAHPGPDLSMPVHQIVLHDVTMERRERAYTASLILAQEEERRRLARDIHDEPLQTLIHMSRRIERFSSQDGRAQTETCERMRSDILGVVSHLRNVARGLRPPGLDQFGLVAAIKGFLADLEDEGEMEVHFVTTGNERRLAPEVEAGVFRIVQEACNNVRRHAEARRLWVRGEYGAASLRMRVIDDGKGYDAGSSPMEGSEHMGLMGMYERANLLGGSLDIKSATGSGTTVDVTIPT